MIRLVLQLKTGHPFDTTESMTKTHWKHTFSDQQSLCKCCSQLHMFYLYPVDAPTKEWQKEHFFIEFSMFFFEKRMARKTF